MWSESTAARRPRGSVGGLGHPRGWPVSCSVTSQYKHVLLGRGCRRSLAARDPGDIHEQGHGQKERHKKKAGKDTDGKTGGEEAKEGDQAIFNCEVCARVRVPADPEILVGAV